MRKIKCQEMIENIFCTKIGTKIGLRYMHSVQKFDHHYHYFLLQKNERDIFGLSGALSFSKSAFHHLLMLSLL